MYLRNQITKELFNSTYPKVSKENITFVPSQDLIVDMGDLLGNITAYDASYVNLARKLNIPLCTSDKKLSKAATKFCDVVYLD